MPDGSCAICMVGNLSNPITRLLDYPIERLVMSGLSRRHFLWLSSAAAGFPIMRVSAQRAGRGGPLGSVPASIASLASMRDQATPITNDERRARIERARRLMAENKLDAIV